jgi:preprotein translocase subunit SecG
MNQILVIVQLIIAGILMFLILLQQRGSGLGSAFGGSGGEFYSTRRGMEKNIFRATVVFGIIFIVLALANLIV